MTTLKRFAVVPIVMGALILGFALASYSRMAFAESGTTTQSQMGDSGPHRGGHIGIDGAKEELLTGDTAAKVSAAALMAVPGGTIERVETDAEGAAYEAHMTKPDGSHVTVKFDTNYGVTATEDGPGRRGMRNK